MLATDTREQALAAVVRDPVRFARGVLGHDVWETPAAIMRAMDKPHARVAVKACHASSKTFTAAEVALWFVTRYSRAKVIDTAPTWTQVETLFWAELRKAITGAKIRYPVPLETEFEIVKDQRFIRGLSTTEAEKFQGAHADEDGHVLIVVDEAPGVKPAIFDAIAGIEAGGDVRILMLGNPTIASGAFHRAFTAERAAWETFTISAFDTPNFAGVSIEELLAMGDDELDQNVKPYLVTRRWVRNRWHEWGAGHPMWEARVLGQFPSQAEDALISLAWLEAAGKPGGDYGTTVDAGVDVAGPGDDETVLVVREGPSILLMRSWAKWAEGDVIAALAPYAGRLRAINVDSAGIGYGFFEHLRALGMPAVAVNVGEATTDSEKYKNLKAELYWGLRERFRDGDVAGLHDETAVGQLAGIRYKHNSRGQIEIETKDDARKRGVKSPDRAEAIMLAFASQGGSIWWA